MNNLKNNSSCLIFSLLYIHRNVGGEDFSDGFQGLLLLHRGEITGAEILPSGQQQRTG